MNTIMVLGGYGQVGGYITKKLLEENMNNDIFVHVVVAGRNVEKAAIKMSKLKCKCEIRKVDVEKICASDLENIDTVIMCLENSNEEVLCECIKNRINYVDITPSNRIIEDILKYQDAIKKAGIVAVLGVGIAPGISNLLADRVARQFDQVTAIESYLMLGVGEEHGNDAIKWLVNNLNTTYEADGEYGKEKVKSFIQIRKVKVGENKKMHDFTRIDLADSHINRKRYPQARVNSWFSYDVSFFTGIVRIMTKIGLFHWIENDKVKKYYNRMFKISMGLSQKMKIGTDKYASIIRVKGKKAEIEQEWEIRVVGNCNSEITAYVAAYVAKKIAEFEKGFHYVGECVRIDEMDIKYSIREC